MGSAKGELSGARLKGKSKVHGVASTAEEDADGGRGTMLQGSLVSFVAIKPLDAP
jgi:hypothetical protein